MGAVEVPFKEAPGTLDQIDQEERKVPMKMVRWDTDILIHRRGAEKEELAVGKPFPLCRIVWCVVCPVQCVAIVQI